MSGTVDLAAAASPPAQAALERMLRALQEGLRLAMAGGPAAAEDPALWAALAAAMAAYDDYLAVVTAAHPMRCRAGCDACCRDNPLGVAGVEALALARQLRAEGRAAAIAGPVGEAASSFREAVTALGSVEAAAAAQRAKGRACPLLGEGGRCTVYAVRPVACRMFYALTPPEWCAPADPSHGQRTNPHLVPPLVCRQILGAVSRLLGRPATGSLWEGLAEALAG